MITYMLTALLFGLCCAVVGVAYVCVVGQDDTPLNWWFRWLFTWQERGGWRSWVVSPLGGCPMCFSGQLALWGSTMVLPELFEGHWWTVHAWFNGWVWSVPVPVITSFCWSSAFLHIIAGCSAILCAMILKQMHKWLKKRI